MFDHLRLQYFYIVFKYIKKITDDLLTRGVKISNDIGYYGYFTYDFKPKK